MQFFEVCINELLPYCSVAPPPPPINFNFNLYISCVSHYI